MHPIDRDFLSYYLREKEYDQMEQLGRLLGVMFKAGEVRSWKQSGDSGDGFDDEDNVLVPLTFQLRPETREGIQKMVGSDGLAMPKGYRRADGEYVVDMGKVTPEEFIAWVKQNRVKGPDEVNLKT